MNAEQAIHSFWSSFSIPAYDENSVPDNAALPYITYSLSYDSFGNDVSMSGSVWYRSMSWRSVTEKTAEISEFLGEGGIIIDTDNGHIWIKKGHPFYRRIGQEEIKRIYINIEAEYFQ